MATGIDDEVTLRANREGFLKFQLRPRRLVDVSVIDMTVNQVVDKWRIPGGGSPDMGGITADGKVMWWGGRYNGVVYAMSTVDGRLVAKIPVGSGPHGLCVFPQPGRYSLGHTGNFR